ncbi:hypothetical protein RND81_06G215600 [Saponaria officinalis]|uniref:Ubiquitin-like domain-containing protein n=1 Tax=Saponaria officinalis TaxID=3572 RepID=A0AAW1KCQ2_SAPOF
MRNWHQPTQDEDDYYEEDDLEHYSDEEEKQEELLGQKAESKSIIVKVKKVQCSEKDELSMKIDKDVELKWLMLRYCSKFGMNQWSHKFMFNGVRVRETDTPLRLSMLDNDIISVFPPDLHHGPLLPQIKRQFSDVKAGKHVSISFFYDGLLLEEYNEGHCAAALNMEDGDIIDAFDFRESSPSVKIITPINRQLTLKLIDSYNGRVYPIKTTGKTTLEQVTREHAKYFGLKPERISLFYCGRRLYGDFTVEEEHLFDGCPIQCEMN